MMNGLNSSPSSSSRLDETGSSVGGDEDIYILESDEQTLLDVQLELAIVKRKLACVEGAYRQLENDYLEFKDANPLAIAIVADVQLDTGADTHADGVKAAETTISVIRANLVEKGESPDCSILLIWMPDTRSASRDFIQGFSASKEVFVIEKDNMNKLTYLVDTLFRLPQVKRCYITPYEQGAYILLPLLKDALSATDVQPSSNSPKLSSPTTKRRRSWTSNSTASNLTKVNGHGASGLIKGTRGVISKITFVTPIEEAAVFQDSLAQLKANLLRDVSGAEVKRAAGHRFSLDLEDLDLEARFDRLEMPTFKKSGREVHEAPLRQSLRPPTPTSPVQSTRSSYYSIPLASGAPPESSALVSEINPFDTSSTPIATVPATPTFPSPTASATPVTASKAPVASAWAQVVRRGRQKSLDVSALPSTPSNAAGNTTSARTRAITADGPLTPISPKASTMVNTARDISPSKIRRQKSSSGGIVGLGHSRDAKHDDESASVNSQKPTELDPSISLCRQKKPPCNQFYLTKRGCTNPKCNYSHTYRLSTRQLDEMRHGASKTACVYRKTGQLCQSGDECVFGHVCPQGSKCKQGGRCQFPPHMH